jgi:hypothetical protein
VAILTTKMSFFSFTKSENKRVEQILPEWGGRLILVGEDVEKGCGRANVVELLYTHVCKWKNETR